MMGLILQSHGLNAMLALVSAVACGVVVWKSIDYIITSRRHSRERDRRDLDD